MYMLQVKLKFRLTTATIIMKFAGAVKIDIILSDCSAWSCNFESLLLKMISYMYVNLIG